MSVRSNLLVHVRQTKSNQKTQDTHAYHYRRRHLETKFIGIGTSLANADFSTSIPLLCWNNYSAWLFTCSLPFSSCDLSFDVLSVLHACISMILIILSMISIELGKLWAIFYVVRSWHEFHWKPWFSFTSQEDNRWQLCPQEWSHRSHLHCKQKIEIQPHLYRRTIVELSNYWIRADSRS